MLEKVSSFFKAFLKEPKIVQLDLGFFLKIITERLAKYRLEYYKR